jgi:PKD repeat protein
MKKFLISSTVIVCGLLALSCNKGPKPVADFTFDPPTSLARDSVHFTNHSTDATTYSWAFGDDSVSTLENPVHVYRQGGTFTVTLTATGEGGTSSYSKDVVITPSVTGKWSSTFTYFQTINGIMTLVQNASGSVTGTLQLTQNSSQSALLSSSNINGKALVVESNIQQGGMGGRGKYSFKGNVNDAYDYITGSAFLDGNFVGQWYAIRMRNSD